MLNYSKTKNSAAYMLVEGLNLWQKIDIRAIDSLDIHELRELKNYIEGLIDDYEQGRKSRRLISWEREERVMLEIEVEVQNQNEAKLVRLDLLKVDRSSGRPLIVFEPAGAKDKVITCDKNECIVLYRVNLPLKQVIAITKPIARRVKVSYYLVSGEGLLPIVSPERDIFAYVKGDNIKLQTKSEEVIRV